MTSLLAILRSVVAPDPDTDWLVLWGYLIPASLIVIAIAVVRHG